MFSNATPMSSLPSSWQENLVLRRIVISKQGETHESQFQQLRSFTSLRDWKYLWIEWTTQFVSTFVATSLSTSAKETRRKQPWYITLSYKLDPIYSMDFLCQCTMICLNMASYQVLLQYLKCFISFLPDMPK